MERVVLIREWKLAIIVVGKLITVNFGQTEYNMKLVEAKLAKAILSFKIHHT